VLVAVWAALLTFTSFRGKRIFAVDSQRDLDAAQATIMHAARDRVHPLSLPYVMTMRVADALWQETVLRLIGSVDVIVVVHDTLLSSTALQWELEQISHESVRERVIHVEIDYGQKVRVAWSHADGARASTESFHHLDVRNIRRTLLNRMSEVLSVPTVG
jgi:hypothetical protein